jgi:hypothetical protein
MNQSYNQLFDEKDLLEENKFQTIYKGCYKDQPQNRVIIQKLKMDDKFSVGFKDFLDSTLQNKLHIEILNDEIVLVSKYIEGDNISLHLNFSEVTATERIDYLYEYLHQATAYIGYENYLFNILIGSSQIVFKEHKLYLKEQINLDRKANYDMSFSMVAKNIGQVMQRMLITNYSELQTSITYDELHMFTESLIRREKDYQNFDDLFDDFKAIYFKKAYSKNQTLIGNAHPNNIFMEFIDVDEYDSRIKETFEPTKEVTDEERAFLMGTAVQSKKDDTKEIILSNPIIEEPIVETYVEPEPIDWSNGPIEESIDLSKLDDVSSLEDLFVKETTEPVVATQSSPKIFAKSVTREANDEKSVEENTPIDEPVYGLPNHFKDPQLHQELQLDDNNEKKPFNFLIPTAVLATLLLIILGFMYIPSLFNKSTVSQVPLAQFDAVIEGNILRCTNESEAYGEATIRESFWELSKDGKVIREIAGENKANFEVKGLSPGVYSIKLTVMDSDNQYSDPFTLDKVYQTTESKALENQIQTQNELASSQSFKSSKITEDTMDQYEISTTVNVIEDTSIFEEGTKSFKIDLGKSEGAASLSFDPIDIKRGSSVSFKIMSNKAEPVTIQLLGYRRGDNVYNKEIISDNGTVLEWSPLSFQMSTTSEIDKLVIRLEAEDTIVWFDELSIRTFK